MFLVKLIFSYVLQSFDLFGTSRAKITEKAFHQGSTAEQCHVVRGRMAMLILSAHRCIFEEWVKIPRLVRSGG